MSRVLVESISKSYGRTRVLEEVSLDIADGEFVTLLGPSGSGKTTLLRIIAGLVAPTSGSVRFGDRVVTHLPPNKRNVAMVFQDYALYPNMRVKDNIRFCLKLQGRPRAEADERVRSVARTLGIEPLLDRWPDQLSGGQKQRVALGRAMVRQPDVFLLDEPLSNLDAQLRFSMRAELQRIHRRLRTTVIHVTHDQEEALSVSQRVALLHEGRLEQLGTPDELYRRPRNLFVARFIGVPSINVFPAEVAERGGVNRLEVMAVPVGLPGSITPRLAALRERQVQIGIRPEDVQLVQEPRDGDIRGEVTVVERLGKDAIVYASTETGEEVTVRGVLPFPVEVGQSVFLSLAPDRLHLFDARTGEAIEPPRGSAPRGSA